MKKRIVILLQILCIIFALAPATALAASKTVTTVKLTIDPPDFGKPLSEAFVPETASTEVTDIWWEGLRSWSPDKFVDNRGHGAYVTVRIKDGLDKVFTSPDNFVIYVNGKSNSNGYVKSVSADKKEAVIFVDFKAKQANGVVWGMKWLKQGDPIARASYDEDYYCTYDNITVRSVPESTTVQPYSWVITEMDVHARDGYLLASVDYIWRVKGKTVVYNDLAASEYVADIEYKDPWTAHVTFYQWFGKAQGEKATDEMKSWLQNQMMGLGYVSAAGRPEVTTGRLRDYLGDRAPSEYKKSNGKDLRAYAYVLPTMGSGSFTAKRLDSTIHILDAHAENMFSGVAGQWYMVKVGDQIGFCPAAYVDGLDGTDYGNVPRETYIPVPQQ